MENGEELGHSFTNYKYNNDAKCGIDGTETAVCDNGCGESDTRTKSGTALEHEYGAWVSNNNGTHTRTCSRDDSHKETKDCNGGNATCNDRPICSDCKEKYDSSLGHNYNVPTYVWNNNECTATRICSRDNSHVETETVTATYVKDTDATCIAPEKGHYIATFINTAFATQTTATNSVINGEELGHSFTNYKYNNDAKCEIDGTETATCDNGCGESDTRTKSGTALEHEYSAWVTNNNGTHTRTCSHNNSHKETKNCNGGAATCRAKAVCVDCNTEYGSLAGHVAKEEWSTTNKIHYHACETQGCTEKLDKENHTFDKNKKCTVCDYVTTDLLGTEISSDVFEINGTNLYVKVSNNQTSFYFGDVIEVAEGATFKVYADVKGTIEIATYMSDIVVGDNTFYITVSNSGSIPKTYTATIRRRPMYSVNFVTNGGTAVATQTIEEDFWATEPTQAKDGYTFTGWDYDFTKPITKNTTINASWKANKDTKYIVEYYLQNLENDKYTLVLTENKTGTTDTTADAEIKTFDHFTHESSSTDSGNIDGKGTLVLKVYYTRNVYTLSMDDSSAGSITNTGSYKYGYSSFDISVTAIKLAYDFLGWYSGNELLTTDLRYVFTATQNITAKFAVKEEMANFYFTSTATTCKITGIKDKTVTEIIVPDYVTEISNDVFSSCSSLTKVNYLGTIDQWAQIEFGTYLSNPLNWAKNLYINNLLVTKANITTATKINSYAFYNCSSLTSVVLGDCVTSIGEYAFSGCDSLTSIVIGDNVTSIGYDAFYNCSSLTSITIPNSVTSIGDYAFYNCSSLTSITIPKSVTSIGVGAFYNCYKLVEVYNKSNLKITAGSSDYGHVGYYALAVYTEPYTSKLSTDSNGYIIYIDGSDKILVGYIGSETDLILPNGITAINQYAFYDCDSLTSVIIGNSVKSIGSYAFAFCSKLTSIEIPDSVTNIDSYAFSGCSSLTSIVIPDSVTRIGYGAFSYCYKLVEVYNKSSLKITAGSSDYGYVGKYALEIYTEPYISKLTTDSNGYIIYTDGSDKILVGYIGSETDLILPNGITAIYQYAFDGCSSLTSIVIPDSVTSIGSYAFYGCYSLTSIVIPDSVTSIGSYAFSICRSLTSIEIPDSVTSIGSSAFEYCYSLTSVIIGNSVTSIGSYAFSGCSSLTSIVIPDSVTSIGYGAFYYCESLTSVTIGDSVTSIGEKAFAYCSSLKNIKYRGSATQWTAISKGLDWNMNTGSYTITYNYDGE